MPSVGSRSSVTDRFMEVGKNWETDKHTVGFGFLMDSLTAQKYWLFDIVTKVTQIVNCCLATGAENGGRAQKDQSQDWQKVNVII